uniref:RWD domain-containing protein n=1 Tax=Heterorhabditis bacteriophora TaxID=37862 RepID=A0A1I7X5P1_HETBA
MTDISDDVEIGYSVIVPYELLYPWVPLETVIKIRFVSSYSSAFARSLERQLIEYKIDHNGPIDLSRAQDTVQWLRSVVNDRYPASSTGKEISKWKSIRR